MLLRLSGLGKHLERSFNGLHLLDTVVSGWRQSDVARRGPIDLLQVISLFSGLSGREAIDIDLRLEILKILLLAAGATALVCLQVLLLKKLTVPLLPLVLLLNVLVEPPPFLGLEHLLPGGLVALHLHGKVVTSDWMVLSLFW